MIDVLPRRSSLLWVLVLLGVFLVEPSTTGLFAQAESDWYQRAMAAMAEKRYDEAVKLYYKAILIDEPLLSGPCRKHDLREAWHFFLKRSEAGDRAPRVPFNLGLIRRICGEYEKALQLLDIIRRRFPREPFPAFVHGEILLQRRAVDKAQGVFSILADHPKGKAFLSLLKILQDRHAPSEERRSLLKEAHRQASLLAFGDAEKGFVEILRRWPEDQEAATGLISLYLETDRLDQALRTYAAYRARPGAAQLPPVFIARMFYQARQFQEVTALLGPRVEEFRTNEYALWLLAESWFQLGRFADAARWFDVLTRLQPKNSAIFLRLAAAHEAAGDAAQAESTLQAAVAATSDVQVSFELAEFLARQGRYPEAIVRFSALGKKEGPCRAMAEERLHLLRMAMVTAESPGTASAVAGLGAPGVSAASDSASASADPEALRNLRRQALLEQVANLH